MKYADLEFSDDGTPLSRQYDDVYFSRGHGPDETRYVFVEQNDLPQRWQAMEPDSHFTVAETGFGTGLNFLVTWQQFLDAAPGDARLTFISCEKFPLTTHDLRKSHRHWPQFAQLSARLQHQYPPGLEGYHCLEFGRVRLLLMFGDATDSFAQLSASVDAWFLDGFAPAKNPDMWQPELFRQLNRLSHRQTTLATFTAARLVRDCLNGAGFCVSRVPGYGKKRHMLRGTFTGLNGPHRPNAWPSAALANPRPDSRRRIAIIGAGIAGVTSAIELSRHGYQVKLFDRQADAACGGSGNSQGAVYAKLSAQPSTANRFYAQALISAQRRLAELPESVPHERCGLVQLAHNERDLHRLQTIADGGFIPEALARLLSAAELSQKTGVTLHHPGLWFPDGGWVAPQQLVRCLIQQHQLDCTFDTEIVDLQATDTGWRLTTASGDEHDFDQVVLTTAYETHRFTQTRHLPLNPISGQVTRLTAQPHHRELKAVICTDRYVMPVLNDTLTIGSTFRVKSADDRVCDEDHAENVHNLAQRVPGLVHPDDPVDSGRAAVRCNSPDYLPLVGAISPESQLRETYQIPLQKKRTQHLPAAEHLPGLWVNIAHGSKGLCSSNLCAQLLGCMIAGEPYPLQAELVKALNPNRFTVRNLIREQRSKV